MKKLENKIINKIYKFETKKTLAQVMGEVFFTILIILSSIFIFSIVFEILNDQKSFDLFNFFQDDLEVIRQYLFQNTRLFVQELPFPLTYTFILLIGVFLLIIYTIFKNFNKIRNKLVSIYKFWFKQL